MFSKQIGGIGGAAEDVFSRDQWRVIQEIFGNCQQPLEHDGPVTISPTFPDTATQAALTVNSWQQGGGLNATGVAIKVNGTINYNGVTLAPLLPGAIIPFGGTAAQLAVYNTHGWYTCDGTNGTPDLRDRFIVCKGSTYTATGGAATHNHTGATGSGGTGNTGSSTTGITVSSHTGNTALAVTGVTVETHAAGNTGNDGSGATTASTHSHTIQFGASVAQSGSGVSVITSVTSPTDAETSHTHAGPLHSHTTPSLTHTVTEPNSGTGHLHSLGTLAHTVNDAGHLHTGPAHTHTISSDSNIPPYYALTFLMFVGA